jgi:quinol-cytochrome oxidoreductase complex cytochrome b subunit
MAQMIMNTKKLRAVELAALAIAAVITVLLMLRAAEWNIDLGVLLFIVWAVSPYICFYIASILVEKFTSLSNVPLISCIVSLLMLAFTFITYLASLNDTSSASSLIFVFVPLLLYIGSFSVLIIGLVLIKLFRRRSSSKT